jgi:5-bromo-4-chloroindolyl phosphate hydrolysis protein
MKREIRKKSVVPVYGLAGVWLIYCLLLPLYRPWHFLILIALGIAAYAGLSKLFPGKTIYVEVPEEPVSTGVAEFDKLLEEGRKAVHEMKRLCASINKPNVCGKINEIIDVTERIFNDLRDDPSDYQQIKRFSDFYLPTTIKLLNAYDRLSDVGSVHIEGENIGGTLTRIEDILDKTLQVYRKQLDALYANEALDIKTDITVLENMLKREGLAGKDF